jgi:Na+-transporting methylmalonyl-CoA/oxaloacetate decarboxylase gamma subunit
MDISFQTTNVGNALALMLMGMAGIFIVMGIILAVVVLLNKATNDDKPAKADKSDGDSKAQR